MANIISIASIGNILWNLSKNISLTSKDRQYQDVGLISPSPQFALFLYYYVSLTSSEDTETHWSSTIPCDLKVQMGPGLLCIAMVRALNLSPRGRRFEPSLLHYCEFPSKAPWLGYQRHRCHQLWYVQLSLCGWPLSSCVRMTIDDIFNRYSVLINWTTNHPIHPKNMKTAWNIRKGCLRIFINVIVFHINGQALMPGNLSDKLPSWWLGIVIVLK